MGISSLEQVLTDQRAQGNLTTTTIANAFREAPGQYMYDIRDPQLKKDIYIQFLGLVVLIRLRCM